MWEWLGWATVEKGIAIWGYVEDHCRAPALFQHLFKIEQT